MPPLTFDDTGVRVGKSAGILEAMFVVDEGDEILLVLEEGGV